MEDTNQTYLQLQKQLSDLKNEIAADQEKLLFQNQQPIQNQSAFQETNDSLDPNQGKLSSSNINWRMMTANFFNHLKIIPFPRFELVGKSVQPHKFAVRFRNLFRI